MTILRKSEKNMKAATATAKATTQQNQIMAIYKGMAKKRSVSDIDSLNDAMVLMLETPNIIEKYDNDIEKAMKDLTRKMFWRNKKREKRRNERYELFLSDNEGNEIEYADNSQNIDTERLEMIDYLLSRIEDDTNKSIFRLYYIYQYTMQEIADKLGVSKPAIHKRLNKLSNIIEKSNIQRLYADVYKYAIGRPAGLDSISMIPVYDATITDPSELVPVSTQNRNRKNRKAEAKTKAQTIKSGMYAGRIEHDIKLIAKDPEPVIGAQTMADWYLKRRKGLVKIYDEHDNFIGFKALKTYQEADWDNKPLR